MNPRAQIRLEKLPVNSDTVAALAHRAHRRRKNGYTDVPVPVTYLEKLLAIVAKVVKNED